MYVFFLSWDEILNNVELYSLFFFLVQQYSAMGSIVETDSDSNDEFGDEGDGSYKEGGDREYMTRVWCVDGTAKTLPTLVKMDRSLLLASMKKRLRMEASLGQESLTFHPGSKKKIQFSDTPTIWDDEEDEEEEHEDDEFPAEEEEEEKDEGEEEMEVEEEKPEQDVEKMKPSMDVDVQEDSENKVADAKQDSTTELDTMMAPKENIHWKKKRKRGKGELETVGSNDANKKRDLNEYSDPEEEVVHKGSSDGTKTSGLPSSQVEEYYEDEDTERKEMEESSIFGQTLGSTNATWVECDKCGKVRMKEHFLLIIL